MKTAIISLTVQGARLGQRIKAALSGEVTCYEKEGRHSGKASIAFQKMSDLMSELFPTTERILCIMSTGIVVRVIAPFIVHKSKDPAIVVMDERGQHAISLLSGHLGGANEWTAELAQCVGADPVITTATDVNGKPAPDVLARKLHFKIDDFQELVACNAAIVAGQRVPYYIDAELYHVVPYFEACVAAGVEVHVVEMTIEGPRIDGELASFQETEHRVVITDKLWQVPGQTLYLRPPTMVVGVGCRRDTPSTMITEAIQASCLQQGRSIKSIFAAASVIVKADEVGLLESMEQLQLPISFYTQEEMAPMIQEEALQESNFVKNTIGVGNVCETTAILKGQSTILIQPKTIYPRTTVALVKAAWSLSELDQVMPMR